jgi:hypothetical protein
MGTNGLHSHFVTIVDCLSHLHDAIVSISLPLKLCSMSLEKLSLI